MAKIIYVCGAGGKTTFCFSEAQKLNMKGYKVLVTTSTHMLRKSLYYIDKDKLINICNAHKLKDRVYFTGNNEGVKISKLEKKYFNIFDKAFDYIIVEADGSKMMPFKIPDIKKEPVFYNNNYEKIYILYNKEIINRRIKDVCFRYEKFCKDNYFIKNKRNGDTKLDKKIVCKIYEHFYIDELKKKYGFTKNIKILQIDMAASENYKSVKEIAFIILASGMSKRFGKENKLLIDVNKNKKLFEIVLDKTLKSKIALEMRFKNIKVHIACVTNDDYITKYSKSHKIETIKNKNYKEGISSAIKLACKKYFKTDYLMYINCDTPYLSENCISSLYINTILSNKHIGTMFADTYTQPTVFNNIYYNDILKLKGDKGGKKIVLKNIDDTYKYYLDKHLLCDIDTKDDYKKYLNNGKEN